MSTSSEFLSVERGWHTLSFKGCGLKGTHISLGRTQSHSFMQGRPRNAGFSRSQGPAKDWWVSVTQSCLTLCDPMDCGPPGFSVHGVLHTRIVEWVAISFSRDSSQARDQTQVSHIADRFFTVWTTGEALISITKESRRNKCWDHWQTLPPSPFAESSIWLWHWCSFLPSWRCYEGNLGLLLQSDHPSSISFISSPFSSVP